MFIVLIAYHDCEWLGQREYSYIFQSIMLLKTIIIIQNSRSFIMLSTWKMCNMWFVIKRKKKKIFIPFGRMYYLYWSETLSCPYSLSVFHCYSKHHFLDIALCTRWRATQLEKTAHLLNWSRDRQCKVIGV